VPLYNSPFFYVNQCESQQFPTKKLAMQTYNDVW